MSTVDKAALGGAVALEDDEYSDLAPLSDRLTVIRPPSRLPRLDLAELWRYRELAMTFVWRDLKVRYKQTAIGVAWALLQPFVTMVVLTLVFGKFAKFPSQNLPYPVFLYSAQLPWTYFASAFIAASASVAQNAPLVTKIYFPRVLLPLSAITVPVVDFVLASSILVGMMIYYDLPFAPQAALSPLFLLLAMATALGAGLIFSVVNVRYRDVPYVIPFLVQIWFYSSGVIYPIDSLRPMWQWILSLNPMTGVITGFRWALVGTPAPQAGQFALSVGVGVLLLLAGLTVFRNCRAALCGHDLGDALMPPTVIEADGLSKRYRIGQLQAGYDTLRDTIAHGANRALRREHRSPGEEIWALRDVSFGVEQGEVLGVIGPNGAGKSTLLKILTRITAPTAGEAVIRGRDRQPARGWDRVPR